MTILASSAVMSNEGEIQLEDLVRIDWVGVPNSLVAVEQGVPYLRGLVPAMVGRFATEGDLLLPRGSGHSFLEYARMYLVSEDYFYLPGSGLDVAGLADAVIRLVLASVDRQRLLLGLGILAASTNRVEETNTLVAMLRAVLAPDAQRRLDAALRPGQEKHWPIARQTVLGAFRIALAQGLSVSEDRFPPEVGALMLTHAVGSSFRHTREDTEERIGGFPPRFAVDIVTNHGFNSTDDTGALLDRTVRLWRSYGPSAAELIGGRNPADIVKIATGLEIEDLLAMAFAVWAYRNAWTLGDPIIMNNEIYPGLDAESLRRFLSFVAAREEDMSRAVEHSRGQWDYLPFQIHPILQLSTGLLLMDEVFLLERVTSGLYWVVHDHLRDESDQQRHAWTQAWGQMVEELCEDQLRHLAPPILGAGSTYFTEDDLGRAFPGSKRSDAVIDFGEGFIAFEIVSKQLTTKTRIDGDPTAFKADLEAALFKKIRQLDETCTNLISEPERLTGVSAQIGFIQPVVVTAGGLPVNPVTLMAAYDYCKEEALLSDGRIRTLAVIDLGEVAMLEGLGESGYSPVDLLARWQRSNIRNISFRNWLLTEFGQTLLYRTLESQDRIKSTLDDFQSRLGVPPDVEG